MDAFERMGLFYLGRIYDVARGAATDEPLLYDARDLTTHAVCVGMTGSGKTGLGVALLEEAAIDGIPAIVIDPKGDLTNLALTFPRLEPQDFRPWIDDGEALRQGESPDEYAARVARTWRDGLAQWGQDGARIERFRSAADVAIYTPGSSAGVGLAALRSLAAPSPELARDADALRERVAGTASSLAALIEANVDPLRSREHILLSQILQHAWTQGQDLDLPELLRRIQSPPLERVGAMDLESFYPARERFELALRVNNLVASPSFAAWTSGEPLHVPSLLWTSEGRPRIAVLSIAHLGDAERMFFVTLLLNEVVAWMRTQPGTTSLRALLYMDEILGYFPPTANPPSKPPMLTLLKQARAFGLGVVLATQNPVDLDYKGLGNAGTWFIGRLQTERDRERVLDGLASAASAAPFDRAATAHTLGGLASRVFLMRNVHESEPVLFQTRWALSYLRGPLTREQIRGLTGTRAASEPPAPAPSPTAASAAPAAAAPGGERPVLPPDVPEYFLGGAAPGALYEPSLLGEAVLHWVSADDGVDEWERVHVLVPLTADGAADPWLTGTVLPGATGELARAPAGDARFADLPAAAAKPASYERFGRALAAKLYRERTRSVLRSRELDLSSRLDEPEGEFRVRLAQLARERRDARLAELEQRRGPQLARLRERLRRAEERLAREQSQYGQRKLDTAISIGAAVLGAVFGRRVASAGTVSRATTAVRGAGRAAREGEDVERATADVEVERRALDDLTRELEVEATSVRAGVDPASLTLEAKTLRPRKADLAVERVALVWVPR